MLYKKDKKANILTYKMAMATREGQPPAGFGQAGQGQANASPLNRDLKDFTQKHKGFVTFVVVIIIVLFILFLIFLIMWLTASHHKDSFEHDCHVYTTLDKPNLASGGNSPIDLRHGGLSAGSGGPMFTTTYDGESRGMARRDFGPSPDLMTRGHGSDTHISPEAEDQFTKLKQAHVMNYQDTDNYNSAFEGRTAMSDDELNKKMHGH